MEIFKEFTFDAAHWLPNVPDGHKCKNMHGHTYRVVITVAGNVDSETGFVMDFGDLKKVFQPIIHELDHKVLNDIIENPTAENIVDFIWVELCDLNLTMVEVWETPTSGARRRK